MSDILRAARRSVCLWDQHWLLYYVFIWLKRQLRTGAMEKSSNSFLLGRILTSASKINKKVENERLRGQSRENSHTHTHTQLGLAKPKYGRSRWEYREESLHCSELLSPRCCCSIAKWCLIFCDPMDCSMPGFPILHHLRELAQTHVHWVSDAIQPSYPLSSPSPPAFNLSQHQGLFQWVSSSGGKSIGASASASILPMNIQGWFPFGQTGLLFL